MDWSTVIEFQCLTLFILIYWFIMTASNEIERDRDRERDKEQDWQREVKRKREKVENHFMTNVWNVLKSNCFIVMTRWKKQLNGNISTIFQLN